MVPNEVIYQDKCPLLNSDEATNILCNKMNNELVHSHSIYQAKKKVQITTLVIIWH